MKRKSRDKAEDNLSKDIISSFNESSFDAVNLPNPEKIHKQNGVTEHKEITLEDILSSDNQSSESLSGLSDLPSEKPAEAPSALSARQANLRRMKTQLESKPKNEPEMKGAWFPMHGGFLSEDYSNYRDYISANLPG